MKSNIKKILVSLFKFIGKFEENRANKIENKLISSPEFDNEVAQIIQKEEHEIDDMELVAVITAAIAALEGTTSDEFVVRSIKKINKSRWLKA